MEMQGSLLRRSRRRRPGCLLLSVVCLITGCFTAPSNPGPPPHPVQGRVLFQGQPAAGFAVAFHPINEWEGAQFSPSAVTDANGEFQLRSYREGDGAPVGQYKVTFAWPHEVPNPDPDDGPTVVDRLQGVFNDPENSQFTVTVTEGINTVGPFELK